MGESTGTRTCVLSVLPRRVGKKVPESRGLRLEEARLVAEPPNEGLGGPLLFVGRVDHRAVARRQERSGRTESDCSFVTLRPIKKGAVVPPRLQEERVQTNQPVLNHWSIALGCVV